METAAISQSPAAARQKGSGGKVSMRSSHWATAIVFQLWNLLPHPAKQPGVQSPGQSWIVKFCTHLRLKTVGFSPHRRAHTPPPDLNLPSLLFDLLLSCFPTPWWGFREFKTNDLRWQQSAKVSVGQQIPLITSNMERLQRGWRGRKVSPSRRTHT